MAGRQVGECSDGRQVGECSDGRQEGECSDGRQVGECSDGRQVGECSDGSVPGTAPVQHCVTSQSPAAQGSAYTQGLLCELFNVHQSGQEYLC